MIERHIFTLICQECGREVPADRPVWGQEYPNTPGSPAVPFCNEAHRTRYIRDFNRRAEALDRWIDSELPTLKP